MSDGGMDEFVWAVTLEGDVRARRAGTSARQKAAELGSASGGVRGFVDRVLDRKTDDRAWRRGAEGEEEVAHRLAPLEREGWTVLHDLPIGSRGANLDHLVIGPGGVFGLNTKHLTGKVEVRPRTLRHNGYSTDYYPKAVKESERVGMKLQAVVGVSVPVRPVIVVMGAIMTVIQEPTDVSVVGRKHVANWLRTAPCVLTPGQIEIFASAARRPSTWSGEFRGDSARRLDGLTVKEWRRFGHDRIYVNRGETALGYLDRVEDRLVVKDEELRPVVEAALRAHLRSAPSGTAGAAPVYRADPSFGSHLGADGDGMGCE